MFFCLKRGEETPKVSDDSDSQTSSPKLQPKIPTFEENLQKLIPDLVTGENQLCSKTEGTTKYTCNANDTLKNALKFTSDGNDEWELLDSINGQKIEIRENPDTQNFPFGIMLIFENMNSEIKLKKKDASDTKTFKQKTFPEFKLENGKFKYAWTIKTLGEKVGLDCKEENGSKTCTLKSGAKINVKDDNTSNKKVEDVTFKGSLKYEEDQGCYNQGFKLTTTTDITLSKEGETSLAIEKLVGSDTSYDIKFVDTDEGANKWYLRKYHADNQ